MLPPKAEIVFLVTKPVLFRETFEVLAVRRRVTPEEPLYAGTSRCQMRRNETRYIALMIASA
jgi:hypothetical protein